jgi:hypothetical protein
VPTYIYPHCSLDRIYSDEDSYTNPDDDHCEDSGIHEILHPVADRVDRVQAAFKIRIEVSVKKTLITKTLSQNFTKFRFAKMFRFRGKFSQRF